MLSAIETDNTSLSTIDSATEEDHYPTETKGPSIVCYEDRANHETGVKLLLLSLREYHPTIDIHAFMPNVTPSFLEWVERHDVTIHTHCPFPQNGFNIKPSLLTWGLNQGYQRVIFLDSDIVLARKLPEYVFNAPINLLIVAESSPLYDVHTRARTDCWQFKLGRTFLNDPTGCFISISDHQRPLLSDWVALLSEKRYIDEQKKPLSKRNIALRGDDELLVALLGSFKYRNQPIKLLSSTRVIAQCGTPGSYTVYARLRAMLLKKPALVHAIGQKPWLCNQSQDNKSFTSPYSVTARKYHNEMDEPTDWMVKPSSLTLSKWTQFFYNSSSMASLPAAFRDECSRIGLRATLNHIKYVIKETLRL